MTRPERGFDAVRVADPARTPVRAALEILARELGGLAGLLAGPPDKGKGRRAFLRFGDLIRATPALRAYQADMMERAVTAATEVLAARAGMTADDPEPQIAARALLGLWRVQADSLRRHLDREGPAGGLQERVTADVHRAARLIENGLRALPG